MAVEARAAERDEQLAAPERARVGGDAGEARIGAREAPARGCGDVGEPRPSRAHRPRARAALAVVERWPLAADDLVVLVALARDQHDVARRRPRQRPRRSPRARSRSTRARARLAHALEDHRDDARRVLGARVVVGDDDAIGEPLGRRAHQRPLAAVAVAAAAEHDSHAAARVRAHGGQRLAERVRRVRVVDDHERAVARR